MNLNLSKFTRSFESFSLLSVKIFINVDASPTGIGILVYGVGDDGSHALLAVSGFNTPYLLAGDSEIVTAIDPLRYGQVESTEIHHIFAVLIHVYWLTCSFKHISSEVSMGDDVT